jgi:hypothetical protein
MIFCLEDKHVIVHVLAGPMQKNFVLEKFVLRMLFGVIPVLGDLNYLCFTSSPYGFKKNSFCSAGLARILCAILGMKVVINIKVNKSNGIQYDHQNYNNV